MRHFQVLSISFLLYSYYSQTTLLSIQDSKKKLEIIHRLICISFIMI